MLRTEVKRLWGFAPGATQGFPQPSALLLCRPGDNPSLASCLPILAEGQGLQWQTYFQGKEKERCLRNL